MVKKEGAMKEKPGKNGEGKGHGRFRGKAGGGRRSQRGGARWAGGVAGG